MLVLMLLCKLDPEVGNGVYILFTGPDVGHNEILKYCRDVLSDISLIDATKKIVFMLTSITSGRSGYRNLVFVLTSVTSGRSEYRNIVFILTIVLRVGAPDTNIVFYVNQCYEWALRKAQLLDWSENSAKAMVLIGDCEPHPPSYTDQRVNWHEELDLLKGMGVKVGGYCHGRLARTLSPHLCYC